MIAADPLHAARAASAGLLNWDAMPTGVRVLVVVLLLGMLAETVRNAVLRGDWTGVFADVLYDGLVVGAAVLCVARAALRRDERLAWALMGVALALWAAGDIYWTAALARLEEPPYPSLADAGYLGFLPVAYVAVVLLVRQRLPHLDARLWLDGVIAALTDRRGQRRGRLRRGPGDHRGRYRGRRDEPGLPARRHDPDRDPDRGDDSGPRPARPHLAVLRRRDRDLDGGRLDLPLPGRRRHLRRRRAARPRLAARRAADRASPHGSPACASASAASACRASSCRWRSRSSASRSWSTTTSTRRNLLALGSPRPRSSR